MIDKILLTLAAIISLASGLYFSGVWQTPVPIAARVFEPARLIKPFKLIDQQGQWLDNQSFKNKWTLIFLGYTHCPDVCPTTLGKLANSYPRLKLLSAQTQVVFISVDPKRDHSARLKEYSAYFNPQFIAASGEHAALFPFVRSLGLMYSMTEDTSQAQYDVSHSGSIVLVNPLGQLHAMFKPKESLGKIPNVDMAILERDFAALVDRF